MKLVEACLNARGDEESIFSLLWRCCEHVQACLGGRKD